jgi:hypothetical protein
MFRNIALRPRPPRKQALVLYKMQIVLQKTIRQSSFSAKTGFGLAPNADRLAKIHPSTLTFRENRVLVLCQMQIVL